MVTINGFNVRTATWDDALEGDGKGDEVFLSVGSKMLDSTGKPVVDVGGTDVVHRSVVMGDTNGQNNRLACGSRSTPGGIRDGDWCMIERPWELDGIGPQPDRPPMNVGEVTLTQGENSFVVSPTIWEWDGGGAGYTEWVSFFRNAVDKVPPGTGGGTGTVVLTAAKLGLDLALQLGDLLGTKGDRPLGITEQNSDGSSKFNPYIVSLTYDSAEWLVNHNPYGFGNGVIPLTYTDATKFRGDYTLYLMVRRIG
jgi:hypothetical protein